MIDIKYILFFLLIFQTVQAQPSLRKSFQYINQSEGLRSPMVKKIIQDKFNFIWVGTQEGLSVYDGKYFKNYYGTDEDSSTRIKGVDVIDLAFNNDSSLLFCLSSSGGLNAINCRSRKVVFAITLDGSNLYSYNTKVRRLLWCNNFLWMATSEGLCYFDTQQKKIIRLPDQNDIQCMTRIKGGILLFCGNNKIVFFNPSNSSFKYLQQKTSVSNSISKIQTVFYKCCLVDNSNVILASNTGINRYHIEDSTFEKYELSDAVKKITNGRDVFSFEFDQQNNLWFSTSTHLYRCAEKFNGVSQIYDNSKSDEESYLNAVFYIYFDSENNTWLGTQKGLVFGNENRIFLSSFYSGKTSGRLENVYYIFPVSSFQNLVCTSSGLYLSDSYSGEIREIQKNNIFYYIFRGPQSKIFISSRDGLFVYKDYHLEKANLYYRELSMIEKRYFNSSVNLGDSILLLGSEDQSGIWKWDLRHHFLSCLDKTSSLKLSSNIINGLYKDSNNNIWSLSDKSIDIFSSKLEKKKTLYFINPLTKDAITYFFDVCELNGFFWVATYGSGILKVNKNYELVNFINKKTGLQNTEVYKVFPVTNQYVFATTNNGLAVLNTLDQTICAYYETDGLHSNIFEEACGLMKDNLIYAGGFHGFTIINTAKYSQKSYKPLLYITNVKSISNNNTKDTTDLFLNEIQISNTTVQTIVTFNAIDYSDRESLKYEYRVATGSKQWLALGNTNYISLIDQPPGELVLEVRAVGQNGEMSDIRTINIDFLPKWYQTIFFKVCVWLLVIGIIYSLFSYRFYQIKKMHKIRKEIADDLHDDIGGTLNSVKVFTHLAKKDPFITSHFQLIEESLDQAIGDLRDMIWVLDNSEETLKDVFERIKKFAEPLAFANNICLVCNSDVELENIKVERTEKKNIVLICKEAVNNCIKHSNCTNLELNFQIIKNGFRVEVKDDGCGFDSSILSQGYGLNNIRNRAEQLHYHLEISSEKNMGTMIVLQNSFIH